jgi:hypothetical protein
MKLRIFVVVNALVLVSAVPAAAQSVSTPEASGSSTIAQPAPVAPTPRHTGLVAMTKGLFSDFTHLPSKENLYWAASGGAIALSLHPLDAKVSRQVRGNDTADAIFRPGRIIGAFPTVFGASAAVYAIGRISDKPEVSHLGMDLLRAIALSSILTEAIKVSTHRERPDSSNHFSFPSGHASDTFAVATALERHLGWKYSIPAFLFSSYVAASRLPSNRHWLSDVAFGAAVGVIAGRTVGSHERHTPVVPITPVVTDHGVALVHNRAW